MEEDDLAKEIEKECPESLGEKWEELESQKSQKEVFQKAKSGAQYCFAFEISEKQKVDTKCFYYLQLV